MCRTLQTLLILSSVIHYAFAADAHTEETDKNLNDLFAPLIAAHKNQTGIYVLEKGEESLLARAWLTDQSQRNIDVQYFIWSSDNIGILASEALLRAAERGAKVRVLVDDLLIDASDESLLALATHPNINIRIYNPGHSVGTSRWKRLLNVITDFRSLNQRLHNKIVLFDGKIGITGGRNMADEYYDYDHEYNFRDRDVLLVGGVVPDMQEMFDEYWQSSFAVPIESLLGESIKEMSPALAKKIRWELHEYAQNPENYAPEVRQVLTHMSARISDMLSALTWGKVDFISDRPGKNDGASGLAGGGETTTALMNEVGQAKRSITIQSPYLVVPEGGLKLFSTMIKRGVKIRIITNSLASTDNLLAYSGYQNQKQKLLEAGIDIFEYKPFPAIAKKILMRHRNTDDNPPVFAIHAKTMVVDGKTLFIGTFNLDPRSANLNTEVGVFIRNKSLAANVEQHIFNDMRPENSWSVRNYDSNSEAGIVKRLKLLFYRLLPLEPVL